MSDKKGESQNIRVIVRCRRLAANETNTQESVACDTDANVVTLKEPEASSGPNERLKLSKFGYDCVLDATATQEEMYTRGGIADFVKAVQGGYNACIFAFGQTGSGKTFTMEGFKYAERNGGVAVDLEKSRPEQLGVTPRAMQQLFDIIKADASRNYKVNSTFVQIYNEKVLSSSRPPRKPLSLAALASSRTISARVSTRQARMPCAAVGSASPPGQWRPPAIRNTHIMLHTLTVARPPTNRPTDRLTRRRTTQHCTPTPPRPTLNPKLPRSTTSWAPARARRSR